MCLLSVTGPKLQNGLSKSPALAQSFPRGPAPYGTKTAGLGSKAPVPPKVSPSLSLRLFSLCPLQLCLTFLVYLSLFSFLLFAPLSDLLPLSSWISA